MDASTDVSPRAACGPFFCKSRAKPRSWLTQARLRELLHYDPETGEFRWLKRVSYRTKVGEIAGCLNNVTGYRHISIGHRSHPAHQLAWLYVTGAWCRPMIDHRDTNRANNRWDNLRRATKSTNAANRVRQRNNSSGFKGVSLDRKSGRWRAQIRKHGRTRFLGLFSTPQAAHAAYVAAARKLFGEFARAG